MATRYIAKNQRRLFIEEWLVEKGMSRADLAREMGTSPKNISTWMAEPWRITLGIIADMEHALGVKPGHLFYTPAVIKREEEYRRAVDLLRSQAS